MDEFARLPASERRVYFEQAAAKLRLSAQLAEKDFWVCWILKRLFLLPEFGVHFTFKGGTTLSKIYRVIERFSEDIDIALERSALGFGGDQEPESGGSGKERKHRLEALQAACQIAVKNELQPMLRSKIEETLQAGSDWTLTLDPDDRDKQTLLFEYPAAVIPHLSRYFASSVKIELGARSDHFPVENQTITPYLEEAIPQSLGSAEAHVRVLAPERTFWEQATILHMLHHQPEKKRVAPRMSRHYYDVFQIAKTPILSRALSNAALFRRVSEHKSIFFKAAWASYETALPGTLRPTPPARIVGELVRDYAGLQPMFFGSAPDFLEILSSLAELEGKINSIPKEPS